MQDNFENLITHKDMQNMEEGIAASYLAAYLHIDYKQFEVRESPDLALTFDNNSIIRWLVLKLPHCVLQYI